MNATLKKKKILTFLHCQPKCYQLVTKIDVAIDRIRNKELEDDYKSRHHNPVITSNLTVYEINAAKIFM